MAERDVEKAEVDDSRVEIRGVRPSCPRGRVAAPPRGATCAWRGRHQATPQTSVETVFVRTDGRPRAQVDKEVKLLQKRESPDDRLFEPEHLKIKLPPREPRDDGL